MPWEHPWLLLALWALACPGDRLEAVLKRGLLQQARGEATNPCLQLAYGSPGLSQPNGMGVPAMFTNLEIRARPAPPQYLCCLPRGRWGDTHKPTRGGAKGVSSVSMW